MRVLESLKKNCPGVYKFLKHIDDSLRVTYRYRMLRAKLTDSRARYWSEQGEAEIRGTWQARNAPSSRYVLRALGKIDFNSLLELGSSCGNRLAVIAAERPGARLAGIDINRLAVECGNKWLLEEGIRNVSLKYGRIEDLSEYADRSFDVVFSWAVLIYVQPARILEALKGALRVSAKAVVLIEMQNESKDQNNKGVYYQPGNWKRDYISLLEKAGADPSRITIEWVDKNIWSPGGGGGACITYVK
jgi:cyclopropane fatty-acyl-phospholipid synthase-like methyltransferase